jgi:phosphoribosylcarboxyaminoimidazole (NCAIR) mutase
MKEILAALGATGLVKSKKGTALVMCLLAVTSIVTMPLALPVMLVAVGATALLGGAYIIGQSIVDAKQPAGKDEEEQEGAKQ